MEAHLPSSGCACAVCSGESPRARQSSITATFSRKLSSVSSTLLLVSERTASASFCARRASQNTRGFLLHPQPFLRLHPLQHLGHAPSLGACIPEPLFGRMLPCLRLRRRDVAVPLDLVVHGRGRPSQQLRDLPAAVAAVEAFLDQPLSGFVSLTYALDWGFLPFFLDLSDMRCQLLPARRLAGLSGRHRTGSATHPTCTADFRNRSYEVCN